VLEFQRWAVVAASIQVWLPKSVDLNTERGVGDRDLRVAIRVFTNGFGIQGLIVIRVISE
jgi:hypothetical protein